MSCQVVGLMAKYIAQIIVTGAQIVGRAFVRAVRQELQASQAAARARSNAPGAASAGVAAKDAVTGMTVQEARQILNLDKSGDIERIQKNFQHLFEINDKSKGGSFYLQSKVVRAKERLDQEIQEPQEETQKKSEKDEPKDESSQSHKSSSSNS
ncbi:Mitochondrial import inner membrane translocase subunit tim16 [Lamellibrachia satsuma]|nr:Mitochondrial import inner membrane translocase subunit tim16 [Lamellibrachia satsuma]